LGRSKERNSHKRFPCGYLFVLKTFKTSSSQVDSV